MIAAFILYLLGLTYAMGGYEQSPDHDVHDPAVWGIALAWPLIAILILLQPRGD